MYEPMFSLEKRPFSAAPLTDRYYPAASIETARKTLIRTIERAEGPGLVIGPAGIGKSLLCRLLAEHFRRTFQVALLASTQLRTRKALFQNILFELGLPYRDMEEGELRLALVDHLAPAERRPNGLLLIIDESHTLPMRLMEEVRMLSNLMRDQHPRVRLILAGGPSLEERFASPKLESFNQRIAARCYLYSLSRDETTAYVQTQFARVGGDANLIFGDDAYRAVFNATDGVPRLINQVCDHALLLASLGGKDHIDAALIEEAWADLQQLPSPWKEGEKKSGSAPAASSSVVEFGELIEDQATSRSDQYIEQTLQAVEDSLNAYTADVVGAGASLPVELATAEHTAGGMAQELRAAPLSMQGGHPSRTIQPEIELYFHGPHDPFADVFEEEEIVIDRYASLEDSAGRQRVRVSSPEGREIAAVFASQQTVASAGHPPHAGGVEFGIHVESPSVADAETAVAAAAAVPSVTTREFDSSLSFAAVSWPTSPSTGQNAQGVESDDDRDLIHIEDQESGVAPAGRGRARRQEYRQLFARLRAVQ